MSGTGRHRGPDGNPSSSGPTDPDPPTGDTPGGPGALRRVKTDTHRRRLIDQRHLKRDFALDVASLRDLDVDCSARRAFRR